MPPCRSAATAARADWKADYPELIIATVPDENATGVEKRYEPFIQYLSKQLGVPVKLRIANDYAAVIEGQIAGNIHIAKYGPASFARALMNGAKIDAFAMEVNKDGTKGYYSVLYVKADSPYQKIEDLKGKNLGLVDPNSTSGNNVPRFEMNKMGIKPEEFFANVVYTGSHENAIIALQQGQVDAAFNWWNDENESMLRRMERKDMAKYDDFRIIFKSDQIVNSPFAMLTTLPAELQTGIKDAFFSDRQERSGSLPGDDRRPAAAVGAHRQRRLSGHRRTEQVRRHAAQVVTRERGPRRRGAGPPPPRSRCMTASAATPPRPTVEQLAAAYAAEVARKRRRFLVAAAVLRRRSCWSRAGWPRSTSACSSANIHKFPNYIGRIFLLDSGPHAGQFVLFDIPGWFWGLGKWLQLLADTLLIAYVATVLGAIFGFLACFLAAGNLGVSHPVSLRRAPLSRVLPHRAGTRLRADLRHGLRPRVPWPACWPSSSTPPVRSASCSTRCWRTSTRSRSRASSPAARPGPRPCASPCCRRCSPTS